MPTKLALTTPCYEDESFLGYLARVSELNVSTVSVVTRLAGWNYQHDSKLARITKQSDEICTLLGLDQRQFDLLAILPSGTGRRHHWIGFGGQVLRGSMIDFNRPKFCAACLNEAPYRRRHWDLSLYTECHLHRISMLDACPSCKARIAWNVALVTACGRCGERLADANTSDATEAALHMATQIAHAAPITEKQLAVWLADQNSPKLAEMCDLITFAGGWKLFGKNASMSLPRMSLSQRRRLLEAAHSLVHGEEEVARTEFFSALMRRPADGTSAKMREIFPKFYAALYSYEASPGLEPLRERFEHFVRHDSGLDLATIGQRHAVARNMPDAYVAVGTASVETGIPHKKLMRVAAANGIAARKVNAAGKAITVISREQLRDIADMLKSEKKFDPRAPLGEPLGTGGRGYITVRQFGERWGLSNGAAWNCLRHDVVPYTSISKRGKMMISIKANADFERGLKKNVAPRPGVRTVSAKRAVRGLLTVGFSTGELFRRLLSGELQLAAIDKTKKGLNRLILYEDDVCNIRRLCRLASRGTLIDTDEAAARLETGPDHVLSLCRQGLLTPHRPRAGRGNRVLLEPSEVQKFAETYICIAALWRRIGKRLRPPRLAQLGLNPAVKAKKVLFFLRKDLEDSLINCDREGITVSAVDSTNTVPASKAMAA